MQHTQEHLALVTGGWAPVELNKNLLNKATLLRQGDGGVVLEHRNKLRVRQNEETKEYKENKRMFHVKS